MPRDYSNKDSFLRDVAKRVSLREGPAGVEGVLRAIFQHEHEPGADALTERVLARLTRLPVPVIVAIRRELEAAGVLEPGLSIQMTPGALKTLQEGWGWFAEGDAEQSEFEVAPAPTTEDAPPEPRTETPRQVRLPTPAPAPAATQLCRVCEGTGIDPAGEQWQAVLAGLQRHSGGRARRVPAGGAGTPTAQRQPTPETNVRRAALMHQYGALAGKDVLVMGSDVSAAAAVALAGKALSASGRLARRVVALHADDRALRQLRDIALAEGTIIGLITRDFHQPLLPDLQGDFDTVFLDAPAELEELVVALTRAQDALRDEGGRIFLSYAQGDPTEVLEAQREMLEAGFLIAQMLPRFDRFADGTTADLYVLQTADWSATLAPVTTKPPGSNGSG